VKRGFAAEVEAHGSVEDEEKDDDDRADGVLTNDAEGGVCGRDPAPGAVGDRDKEIVGSGDEHASAGDEKG